MPCHLLSAYRLPRSCPKPVHCGLPNADVRKCACSSNADESRTCADVQEQAVASKFRIEEPELLQESRNQPILWRSQPTHLFWGQVQKNKQLQLFCMLPAMCVSALLSSGECYSPAFSLISREEGKRKGRATFQVHGILDKLFLNLKLRSFLRFALHVDFLGFSPSKESNSKV